MLTNTIFSRLTRARLTASSSCFCFLFALSGIKREPQTRVGLVTSSLPRKRSTTELLRLAFYSHSLLSTFSRGVGLGSLSPSPLLLSGRRGSNPPPIAWKAIALPNELLPPAHLSAYLWGRVDSNHRTLPRTDLQSVAIAAMRLPQYFVRLPNLKSAGLRADEGTRTPDRLITNQLLYQLSYIGFLMFNSLLHNLL